MYLPRLYNVCMVQALHKPLQPYLLLLYNFVMASHFSAAGTFLSGGNIHVRIIC